VKRTQLLTCLLLAALAGCTRQDNERVERDLQSTKQQVKEGARQAAAEIKKGAKEAGTEMKKGAQEVKRELKAHEGDPDRK
jgi:dsDNA-specific endonuclease/ATPase MutS2